MAVASNARRVVLDMILRSTGLARFFDAVLSADDADGVRLRPARLPRNRHTLEERNAR